MWSKSIDKANILITGGTGSFGFNFVDYITNSELPFGKIIIYSRDEYKQFTMKKAFHKIADKIQFVIGDIRNLDKLKEATSGIDFIINAAALKHIATCEENSEEAIATNIIGAQNIITAAGFNGVKKVINISTDKAVNPCNFYGSTKSISEQLFTNANKKQIITKFANVRYGNVIGSRGSVVPIFNAQKKSNTLTITDANMTRFWITLEHGIKLVLYALDFAKGGEIFVPKLRSKSIKEIAKCIAPDAALQIIGQRAGEKIHEELIAVHENYKTLEFDDIYIINNMGNIYDKQVHKPVNKCFTYTSDKSPSLTDQEFIKLMQNSDISNA